MVRGEGILPLLFCVEGSRPRHGCPAPSAHGAHPV